jgi:hypothetical protein
VCRSLKVLCAARGPDLLGALKRATVSASWELVGGVADGADLLSQLTSWRPDVVVLQDMGEESVALVRSTLPLVRIVSVGVAVPGADAWAGTEDDVRDAVLRVPRPGGPVRG